MFCAGENMKKALFHGKWNFFLFQKVAFRKSKFLAGMILFCALALPISESAAENQCSTLFGNHVQDIASEAEKFITHPATKAVITKALALAQENRWPVHVLEVGPEQRKIARIFVGVDVENKDDMQVYRSAFLPALPLDQGGVNAGTLPLEFAHVPNDQIAYVYGFLRTGAEAKDLVVRHNQPPTTYDQVVQYFLNYTPNSPISHYANLIGLNSAERENFQTYLSNYNFRGRVKSENCVAWCSSIELGRTHPEATTEERQHLFTVLGMARSYDPKEISSRLVHAANERHRVIFVFYRGSLGGREAFNDLSNNMTMEPKISYSAFIKGLKANNEKMLEAMKVIPDGSRVFFPIAAGASPEGMQGLIAHGKKLEKGIDVHLLVNGISEATLKSAIDEGEGKIRLHALFLGGNMRQLYRDGNLSVIPGYLADFPYLMKENNADFAYDAIVVRVSKPDAQGNHSLGMNHDMITTILETRPGIKIIAEINSNVPYVPNGAFIAKNRINASFESSSPLAGPVTLPTTAVEASIGEYLGQLVPSGATLQIGIGNVFGGIPYGFSQRRIDKLKIWTEMLSDPMMELIKQGRVDHTVTGFVFGSPELYKWLDGNKQVYLRSTAEVNDPIRIKQIEKFHAVNTALQVNLRGDANATHGPEGRLSSPGGQVEFMSGAARSLGGKAIIALRSTAKNGEVSSIALDTYHGSITTTHENVTHVVTEYGIAVLQGKSERHRAVALISIAHPKFRRQLAMEALHRKLIQAEDATNFADEVK